MLTIIFGAGASFDSAPSIEIMASKGSRRPPLANQLFEDRDLFADQLDRFLQCRPLVPRLRHLEEDVSIEQELERLQMERGEGDRQDITRARQLAAVRFYIQSVIYQCSTLWLNETK